MSGHLPECLNTDHELPLPEPLASTLCICDRLRACEQRERQRSVLLIADAYAAGVQAARDAVAALRSNSSDWGAIPYIWKHDALAAIDALRGQE